MARIEPYNFHWDRFPLGKVTAVDEHRLPPTAASLMRNLFPNRFGNLATRPKIEVFASDYSVMLGISGTPLKVVGTYVWQPVSGRDILVVAVYGNWERYGKGTMLVTFFDDEDAGDFGFYEGRLLTFIRSDAPIRFCSYAMTNPYNFKRSNWLVVCTPYDYSRLIEYDDPALGYQGRHIWLPYFWADAISYQRRLLGTGAFGVPYRLYYSDFPDSVERFNSLDIGEETGDPNLFFQKAFGTLFIQKSRSMWILEGETPDVWRPRQVLSTRGTCAHIPASAELGILACDAKGLYHSDGVMEHTANLSDNIPELKGNQHNMVPFHDLILIDHEDDFEKGGYEENEIAIENLGTEEHPIWVLTLAREVESVKDEQLVDDAAQLIEETKEAYQTFKAIGGYGTTDHYWATKIELKLEKAGVDDSDLWVELVEYTGNAADPDTEEILGADLITDIDGVAPPAYYEVIFPYPIFLKPDDDIKYMIRVVGITKSTNWRYNTAGGYADGESSWDAGDDACFKVTGFQYKESGLWMSPWYDCKDVSYWGALLYNALDIKDDWENRTYNMEYWYRQGSSGPMTAPQGWYLWPNRPDGGALSNEFDKSFNQIRFKAFLRKQNEIPPFIDYFLITFSRMISELTYPSGLEDRGVIYLSGLEPETRDVLVRNAGEEGALFPYYQTDLAHFVLWRDKLWAGAVAGTNAGSMMRVMQDRDTDRLYEPVAAELRTGFQGIDDSREKQLWVVKAVWYQSGDKAVAGQETQGPSIGPLIEIRFYLLLDDQGVPLEYDLEKEVETRLLSDGRYEWTLKMQLPDNLLTKECGVLMIIYKRGDLGSTEIKVPIFELKEFHIETQAWPESAGIS